MRRRAAAVVATALVALLAFAIPAASAPPQRGLAAEAGDEFRVLVYSRTAGFRHLSITTGVEAIRELGATGGFTVDATEDPALFTPQNLRRYSVVLFLNTTGTVLETAGKAALQEYVRGGGGFVGIHSAADTEHDWPYYGRLVGAYFRSHPLQQIATIVNEDPSSPATAHLPERFPVFDEFYSFDASPREDVRVLLTIDETTYLPDPNTSNLPGGTPATGYMGDHPMAWCHDNLGGRVFYTALGHEGHLYDTPWYREHVLQGILLAAGRVEGTCTAKPDDDVAVRVPAKRLVVGAHRTAVLPVKCLRREEHGPCGGKVVLRASGERLARAGFEARRGRTDAVELVVSKRSKRLIGAGELAEARAVVTASDEAGNRVRLRVPLALALDD